MSLLDPLERAKAGTAKYAEATGLPLGEPKTAFEASLRDFVFAEIWTRPGLDTRSRLLISLAGTATTSDDENCRRFIAGALAGDHLSPTELREVALQLVVYSGWPVAGQFDQLVTEALQERGLAEPALAPLQSAPISREDRLANGARNFAKIAQMTAPSPFTPYVEAGVLNFVMGEVWCRPGLDERSRRLVTLVGAGFSGSDTPMRSHAYSALASGNLTKDELLEFVLHFSVYAGWPRGSVFQRAVLEQAACVEKGLPFSP